MSNVKVSIIVPIYNVEKYLDRCMDSLLNQTLKDIEIIMVDDGSPDNCPQMCDEYAKKDNRVKVIHKRNAGLGEARNSGLEIVVGEYVAFVDSDDFVEREMYEKLYKTAQETNSDTVYCGFSKYLNNGKTIRHQHAQTLLTFKNRNVNNLLLDFIASSPDYKQDWKYEMSVWHGIYSTKIIQNQNIRFVSERIILSEDLPFQVKYLKEAKAVAYMPECYYYYCMNNSGSLTHANYSPDKLCRTIKLINFLTKETLAINGADIRVKRFFICYLRALLYGIVSSDFTLSKKYAFAKELSNKKVWTNISGFPYRCLNLNSRVICYLQRHGYVMLALTYVNFINQIKKIKEK